MTASSSGRHQARSVGCAGLGAAGAGSGGIGRRALLLGLPLAGCAALPLPDPGPRVAGIAVVERDWHTDIALPVGPAPLHPALAALAADFPGMTTMVFGFGDRRWLLDRDRSPLALLRALLPGAGAILLTALAAPPEAAFGPDHIVRLPLTAGQMKRLQEYLAGSLDQGRRLPGGRWQALAEGPYPGSVFLASPIIYSAGYTCNTWTAHALAAAGLPIDPAGVVFAGQAMAWARQAAEVLGASSDRNGILRSEDVR
ncbi:DUF2459 domain-containing protein [Belnapia sp. T18]|uniref:DUF2459 domain-containing protein n=1 Tax=Belnapia arida TaxID=2804533 RepID=A0ABS1U059_9PROT|nr:DUF2459 domain-containing protein [Belnapia arida]MBL6078065.1 DUF2459 domain-containing protein [Belnapia arida]